MNGELGELEKRIADLKELLQTEIKAVDQNTKTRLDGMDKALERQEKQDDEHFKLLNNEAGRLLQQQATSVSKEVYDAGKESVNARLISLEKHDAKIDGKADQSTVLISYAFGALGILIAIISIVLGRIGK